MKILKIGAIEFSKYFISKITDEKELLRGIEGFIKRASEKDVDLLVFPGFTGCFYQWLKEEKPSLINLMPNINHNDFIGEMAYLSNKYKIILCPGSYYENREEHLFHTSCVLNKNAILLEQRQIYLAKWEKELYFTRGKDIYLNEIEGFKVAIILSTDTFYPQVARRAALKGAEIILSPIGFVGKRNPWLQASGTWQTTQLNHFFAVEAAFNGEIEKINLWGESRINAPLSMTDRRDGILKGTRGKKDMIYADLDKKVLKKAKEEFDVLKQLNPSFYGEITGLGGIGK